MKKLTLLIAALSMTVAPALAAGTGSATFNITYTANVMNVCSLNGSPIVGDNGPYNVAATPFDYNAAATGFQGSTVGQGGTASGIDIVCTKGTAVTLSTTAGSGGTGTKTATTSGGDSRISTTDTMTLTNNSDALKGNYLVNINRTFSANGGDRYEGDATYSADAGQYSVPKGTYTGTLTVMVSYQ